MITRKTFAALCALPVCAGLGMAAAGANQSISADEAVRCEIEAGIANGMIAIEGLVHSRHAFDGEYRFTIDGGGGGNNTRIDQSGAFAASPDAPATVGRALLGPNGFYDTRLEITAGGKTLICDDRIGGAT